MTDALHPLARDAMRLALRPKAEAEQRIAELAGGDLAALDEAHRDLCRRLALRPHEPPAAEALRLVHALRDRLRSAARTTLAA
jgi:hypothetical protein